MSDWRDQEVSSGLLASCVRWVRERLAGKPREELRGVITARTDNGPIACALVERTWRGEWTTEVVFALEGMSMAPRSHRTFADARWAFWMDVQSAIERTVMGAREPAKARPEPDWSVN